MILNFNEIEEQVIPNFKGGEKQFRTRMYTDASCKIMRGSLEPGAAIGVQRDYFYGKGDGHGAL